MIKKSTSYFLLLLLPFCFYNCEQKTESTPTTQTTELPTLKSNFKNNFVIGAALNDGQINGTDTKALAVIEKEFNTITPENIMKWMYLHPQVDSFYFDMADKYVALGEKNDMYIVGHTLVWHSQIAEFMNEVKDAKVMEDHLKNHVNTIVNRYKGRIDAWDVVNEALNEDGSFRASNFYKVMGDKYLEIAFKLAEAADPNVDLLYNDYNLWKPEKRAGVVRLVKQLQASGAKIDGVGMQAHWSLVGPDIKDIENSILAYSELGVKVSFTELDVTALPNPWDLEGAEVSQNYEKYEGDAKMDPYRNELPDSMQLKIANRYDEIFKLFLKHQDKIDRVTFWGVNDGQSWLNDWPIKGRTNHPLFFDRNYQPKAAYQRVMNLGDVGR